MNIPSELIDSARIDGAGEFAHPGADRAAAVEGA